MDAHDPSPPATPTPKSKSIGDEGTLVAIFSTILIVFCALDNLPALDVRSMKISKAGIDTSILITIGFVELALAVLFVIPRFRFLAAIVLTGCAGTVAAIHLWVGYSGALHIVMGLVVWLAIWLRWRKARPTA